MPFTYPSEYRTYKIEDIREMTAEYPELRVYIPYEYGTIPVKVSGITFRGEYAYITDEDAYQVNVPRWNKQAREHYLKQAVPYAVPYPDVEYGIETARITIRVIEEAPDEEGS